MLSRTRIKSIAAASVMLVALGGPSAAQQSQEACLSRLPTDRVTLNLRDANTQTTLRLLAQQYQINMVVTDDVKGTVALDFFKVPVREVFQAILDAANLRCAAAGEVLRVSTAGRLKAEEDERAKQRESLLRLEADTRKKLIEAKQAEDEIAELIARGPIREETIRLRYADAEEVAKTIQGILGLRTGAFASTPVPLPQLSQLYVPSPPVNIPDQPPPPQTTSVASPTLSPDALAKGLTVRRLQGHQLGVHPLLFARPGAAQEADPGEPRHPASPDPDRRADGDHQPQRAGADRRAVGWGCDRQGGRRQRHRRPGLHGPAGRAGAPPINGSFANNTGFTGNHSFPSTRPPAFPSAATSSTCRRRSCPRSPAPTPPAACCFGLIGSNFNVNLAIQALEVQGKARTLAEPKIDHRRERQGRPSPAASRCPS